jgi:hypothetical protein
MSARRTDADALLELALHTLRSELGPALPAEQRYAAAMVANALEIVRRSLAVDPEAAQWALLDRLYDDGEGSLRQLATDIRRDALPADRAAGLEEGLRQLLRAELALTNPRFLADRRDG